MNNDKIDSNNPNNTEDEWTPVAEESRDNGDNPLTFREAVYMILVVFAFVAGILVLFGGMTNAANNAMSEPHNTDPTQLYMITEHYRHSDQYDYVNEYTFKYTTGNEYAELHDVHVEYEGNADFFVLLDGEEYEGDSHLLNKNTTYEFKIVFFGMDLLESKIFELHQVRLEINDDFHYTPTYYSGN